MFNVSWLTDWLVDFYIGHIFLRDLKGHKEETESQDLKDQA